MGTRAHLHCVVPEQNELLLLTIFGGISYPVSSKNTSDINSLLVLSGAYILQCIVCLAPLPFFRTLGPI